MRLNGWEYGCGIGVLYLAASLSERQLGKKVLLLIFEVWPLVRPFEGRK
jgi:hypothetical protein